MNDTAKTYTYDTFIFVFVLKSATNYMSQERCKNTPGVSGVKGVKVSKNRANK